MFSRNNNVQTREGMKDTDACPANLQQWEWNQDGDCEDISFQQSVSRLKCHLAKYKFR
jgi:hypothetical protein